MGFGPFVGWAWTLTNLPVGFRLGPICLIEFELGLIYFIGLGSICLLSLDLVLLIGLELSKLNYQNPIKYNYQIFVGTM